MKDKTTTLLISIFSSSIIMFLCWVFSASVLSFIFWENHYVKPISEWGWLTRTVFIFLYIFAATKIIQLESNDGLYENN